MHAWIHTCTTIRRASVRFSELSGFMIQAGLSGCRTIANRGANDTGAGDTRRRNYSPTFLATIDNAGSPDG